jgi:hypothetical protein
VAPRRLPATGGAFSANLCSGFLPSSSAFRGLRHDRRVDTHRFEHGGSSCPRCHRDNRVRWPRLRLKSSINATPSARSVEANIYRTETIFSQRKFGSRAHRQAAGHRARREPLTRCSPTERRFVGCPDLWHSGRFLDPRLLRSRRGPSMKRTPCSPSATPTGRRSVTSVSSGRDAQPRNGSPATRVLTYNAFVR